jgi:hypothetical protein
MVGAVASAHAKPGVRELLEKPVTKNGLQLVKVTLEPDPFGKDAPYIRVTIKNVSGKDLNPQPIVSSEFVGSKGNKASSHMKRDGVLGNGATMKEASGHSFEKGEKVTAVRPFFILNRTTMEKIYFGPTLSL